jgi:hypothetical protein
MLPNRRPGTGIVGSTSSVGLDVQPKIDLSFSWSSNQQLGLIRLMCQRLYFTTGSTLEHHGEMIRKLIITHIVVFLYK